MKSPILHGTNYTILEMNTLCCFEHRDTKALYLRGSGKNEKKALNMALQWQEYLRPFLEYMRPFLEKTSAQVEALGLCPPEKYNDKAVDEVIEFIKERHFRTYFPNQ